MEKQVISRKNAAALKLKHYYTGVPCKWGHDSPRYTSTGNCCACVAGNGKNYARRLANADMGDLADQMVQVEFWVHKDDLAGLQEHVNALRMARKLTGG